MMRSCRNCGAPLTHSFVDLGETPLANSYIRPENGNVPDPTYPLHARVCSSCFLVQVDDAVPAAEIFSDYAYFSSFSDSWVEHARCYAEGMIDRFGLTSASNVVEVASNDGYLLQHFVRKGIGVRGVEPAANVAKVAEAKGVPTEVAFFGKETARRLVAAGYSADLMVANNVLAHVPDINDFVEGFRVVLKPQGVWTVEFPHLLNLIRNVQFDTIYHEHYSYLSLLTVEKILANHDLRAFDVEEVATHGGSLRLYVCGEQASYAESSRVEAVRTKEKEAGLERLETYDGFSLKVQAIRDALLSYLNEARSNGKKVVAYGAAAKGNTLLNYCGIDARLVLFVADRSTEKQGRFLPGSRLPVVPPEVLSDARPDHILILPWNLREEIVEQLKAAREWGATFVVAIPHLEVF